MAGDHALAVCARGGVYVAGGIAPKILGRLQNGGFMAAFNAKGVHAQLNLKVPVHVVTTERLGLLGAALIPCPSVKPTHHQLRIVNALPSSGAILYSCR